MRGPSDSDQLALVEVDKPRSRRASRRAQPVAEELPVARVLVDVPLPHLDRPFDYLVPAASAGDAVPGARVSVTFAGKVHDGFILERLAQSEHPGRLARLRRVVSPEPVLAAEIAQLARTVADRYAGTMADVLRLAVPPRHAAVEAEPSPPSPVRPSVPDLGGWARHVDGERLLRALGTAAAPRAVWNPGPDADWPDLTVRLVVATVAAGRGALVVVPDTRDVARVDAAMRSLIGTTRHVVLTAELGPAERYRRWLAVRRGAVPAVVGTRSAMFAPVAQLGLVIVWDDGDDLHAEPRAPYPHVREVLLLRAHQQGSAAVVGGFLRTAEAEQLVTTKWARPVAPTRADVRAASPRLEVSGGEYELGRDAGAQTARLPSVALRAARQGLARGPVLVQVPRAGYVPGLVCTRCRTPARCASCSGPLGVTQADGPLACHWCGRTAVWRCPDCGQSAARAITVGTRRTAEELGRAFPGVPVRVSQGAAVLAQVAADPALVVATPGAEPDATGGYAAALLLDGNGQLARPGLRSAEEVLRRWFAATALVQPAAAGGVVVLVAASAAAPVQALVRWDPAGFASRELADRASLRFPPAARVTELTGAPDDVADLLARTTLSPDTETLGPVPCGDDGHQRVLLRTVRRRGTELAAAVRAAQGVRSARRVGGPVRVRVDPVDLG